MTAGSPYLELLSQFPDSVRHPLVADSEDWEQIAPALMDMGNAMLVMFLKDPELTLCAMRTMFECVYVKGYERGRKERRMPEFVVAEVTDGR